MTGEKRDVRVGNNDQWPGRAGRGEIRVVERRIRGSYLKQKRKSVRIGLGVSGEGGIREVGCVVEMRENMSESGQFKRMQTCREMVGKRDKGKVKNEGRGERMTPDRMRRKKGKKEPCNRKVRKWWKR